MRLPVGALRPENLPSPDNLRSLQSPHLPALPRWAPHAPARPKGGGRGPPGMRQESRPAQAPASAWTRAEGRAGRSTAPGLARFPPLKRWPWGEAVGQQTGSVTVPVSLPHCPPMGPSFGTEPLYAASARAGDSPLLPQPRGAVLAVGGLVILWVLREPLLPNGVSPAGPGHWPPNPPCTWASGLRTGTGWSAGCSPHLRF